MSTIPLCDRSTLASVWSLTYQIDPDVFRDDRNRRTVVRNIQRAYTAMNRDAFTYQAKQPNCNQASVRRFLNICLRGLGGCQLFAGSSQYMGFCLTPSFPEEQLKEVVKFLETSRLGTAVLLIHKPDRTDTPSKQYPEAFVTRFCEDLTERIVNLEETATSAARCKTSPQRKLKVRAASALYNSMLHCLEGSLPPGHGYSENALDTWKRGLETASDLGEVIQ